MIYVSIFNSCVNKKGSSPLAQIPIRLIVFMCFALSACSDRESAPITDAVYTASNVHMNNEVISETAEIDALCFSFDPVCWGGHKTYLWYIFSFTSLLIIFYIFFRGHQFITPFKDVFRKFLKKSILILGINPSVDSIQQSRSV